MTTPSILFEVKSLSNLAARRIARALAEDSAHNPTGMQGFILGFLGDNRDKDIFQRDVEAELQVRRSTVTGILQLMEKNGLIKRHPVEHDARLKKLVLTPQALGQYENVMRVIYGIEEKAVSRLTEAEIEMFCGVLHKIQENLEQEDLQ
jgi:DNA-binding MarR family transcriptional regulator